jgi:hypothetical protein
MILQKTVQLIVGFLLILSIGFGVEEEYQYSQIRSELITNDEISKLINRFGGDATYQYLKNQGQEKSIGELKKINPLAGASTQTTSRTPFHILSDMDNVLTPSNILIVAGMLTFLVILLLMRYNQTFRLKSQSWLKNIKKERPSQAEDTKQQINPISETLPVSPVNKSDVKMILGIAGSVILIIGVFLPIFKIPMLGTINYFNNGNGDGTIVLILAVVSLVLIVTKRYRGLWATGVGSLGMLAYTYFSIQSKLSQGMAQMDSALANNPFGGMAKAMMDTAIQWQVGLPVMSIGAGLLIAVAVINEKEIGTQ